ncbi:hypothetical protein IEQ34_020553 [Dendrobium chrysotoxum]|uniref:Uncharacterized protein n=1 Tax=Dendrobium chrysotoxum TaxID=161865 RepID=A0AAV7G0S3_DENCH|nr:hypothetical protein IEQ34_020553 [Dendrobium chrysotoxum]
MQNKAMFTTLARYTPHLIPNTEEKIEWELKHPLVPLRIQEFFELVLIKIHFAVLTYHNQTQQDPLMG